MKKYANILLHHSAHYRSDLFAEGFKRHGFVPIKSRSHRPTPNDVLLIWNRNPPQEKIAQDYERAGATVVVAENGYIGKTKALALNHHNGAGRWYVGDTPRHMDIDVKPWRRDGDHILVLPQRSIGEKGIAMPRNWLNVTLEHLKRKTKRPIKVRQHPGKDRDVIPLEDDLRGVWAVVTWGSGAGIKAMVAGVPVFYQLKDWIGRPAATSVMDIENPWMGDRYEMLRWVSWAQWNWDEIKTGEAFKWLLNF